MSEPETRAPGAPTDKRPPKEVLAAEFSDEALFAHPTSFAPGLLSGKVVLLTGAGGGIGRAVAWLTGRLGATVVIAGRKQEKLDVLSGAMREKGLKVHSHLAEMRERDQVDALIDFALGDRGRDRPRHPLRRRAVPASGHRFLGEGMARGHRHESQRHLQPDAGVGASLA